MTDQPAPEHHPSPSGNSPQELPVEFQRYARQIRFLPIGQPGQMRLAESTAVIVGCGALGSVIANTVVRAGVGLVHVIDRDYLELTNLQRQVLYDEADVAAGLPKAIAAARKLKRINSQVDVQPHVLDVNYRNIRQLAETADVILDGTDNFETRFLINDVALDLDVPWVYGGCVGSEGQSMTVVPGQTACLRCLMVDGPPPPGTTPTCDSAGILGPVVNIVASIQSVEALKILSGNLDAINPGLMIVDLWSSRISQMNLGGLPEKINCPACRRGVRDWLSGKKSSETAVLCGRNAVQIRAGISRALNLEELNRRLQDIGKTECNEFLLRLFVDDYEITVFQDGRAIIVGTDDISRAKSLYAQWIGA